MKVLFLFIIAALLIAGCETEPQVVTLDSGLQFMEDTLGTGGAAEMGDLVTFHFKGWMVKDSTEDLFSDWESDSTKMKQSIGSSYAMNQPQKFVLGTNNFIKGSDEGIVGMKVGGTRTIVIPSELAYGKKGIGPIPPDTDIKIVVTLLDVKHIEQVEQWKVDPNDLITTDSGLKYAIIKEGSGATPDSGDVLTVDYSGWLQNGDKFDSSIERGEPFRFAYKVMRVIKGWEEGLSYMKEGSKVRLVIPPDLGYGDVDKGVIPPNSTLIFDVELIKVEKK